MRYTYEVIYVGPDGEVVRESSELRPIAIGEWVDQDIAIRWREMMAREMAANNRRLATDSIAKTLVESAAVNAPDPTSSPSPSEWREMIARDVEAQKQRLAPDKKES